jgi:hypothetical protein
MVEKDNAKINPIMRNMLKGFIPMIKGQLGNIDGFLNNYLSSIELQADEIRVSVLCSMGKDEKEIDRAYIVTCTLDKNDTPKRVIEKMLVSEFLEKIISKI